MTGAPDVVRDHFLVIDDFLPLELARGMREDIESHFAAPHAHQAQTHQVWNYWYVPGLYTYLRTTAMRVIQPTRVNQFMAALSGFVAARLGMKVPAYPLLSLYIDGCRQALHNDAKGGQFAFVYSLTKNDRRTSGGETVILHEGDPFRRNLAVAASGTGFYTEVSPRFNRLVIFDDRIPHGVSTVEGPMDPVEGRFVMHGHIEDGGPVVDGPLTDALVGDVLIEAMSTHAIPVPANIASYHGPLVLRFVIGPDGKVQSLCTLVDRVIGPRDRDWNDYVAALESIRRMARFPSSNGLTTVTEPILFGAVS